MLCTAASKESRKVYHVRGSPEKIGKVSFGRRLADSVLVIATGVSVLGGVGTNSVAFASSGVAEIRDLCSRNCFSRQILSEILAWIPSTSRISVCRSLGVSMASAICESSWGLLMFSSGLTVQAH